MLGETVQDSADRKSALRKARAVAVISGAFGLGLTAIAVAANAALWAITYGSHGRPFGVNELGAPLLTFGVGCTIGVVFALAVRWRSRDPANRFRPGKLIGIGVAGGALVGLTLPLIDVIRGQQVISALVPRTVLTMGILGGIVTWAILRFAARTPEGSDNHLGIGGNRDSLSLREPRPELLSRESLPADTVVADHH